MGSHAVLLLPYIHIIYVWACVTSSDIFGASLSEQHTYGTAVQNPPYIYICSALFRLSTESAALSRDS